MLTPKLIHRITLQQQTRELNSDHEYHTAWTDWLADEPAQFAFVSGRDFIQSAVLQSQVVARVTIRWRPDVSPNYRLLFDGKVYAISAILPDPSARRWLTILVNEGINDGQ